MHSNLPSVKSSIYYITNDSASEPFLSKRLAKIEYVTFQDLEDYKHVTETGLAVRLGNYTSTFVTASVLREVRKAQAVGTGIAITTTLGLRHAQAQLRATRKTIGMVYRNQTTTRDLSNKVDDIKDELVKETNDRIGSEIGKLASVFAVKDDHRRLQMQVADMAIELENDQLKVLQHGSRINAAHPSVGAIRTSNLEGQSTTNRAL
ncbi:hypothetical protein IAU59_006926 [Kwoniella sp. CBS 9459]